MSEQRSARPPSDAVLTVPNLLTFFRLALIPIVLWLALGPDRIAFALVLALIGFATDLVDGKIARRYGQISKLGIALDPLADRLALAAGAVVFIVHDLSPLWVIVAVGVRDALLVLIGAPILKAARAPLPPVSRVGKYGSFGVSVAFALFFASGWPGPQDPIEGLRSAGVVVVVVSLPLYYAAAIGYARTGIEALRARSSSRDAF